MIFFNTTCDFTFGNESDVVLWLSDSIGQESHKEGEINYIFCDDEYLTKLNVKYMKHNTLTDVISFDYTLGKLVSGEIYISIERVQENSEKYKVSFQDELHRVMIHGLLHFFGYKDKTEDESKLMREKENYYLSLRTF